jgi:hypothetical protein
MLTGALIGAGVGLVIALAKVIAKKQADGKAKRGG